MTSTGADTRRYFHGHRLANIIWVVNCPRSLLEGGPSSQGVLTGRGVLARVAAIQGEEAPFDVSCRTIRGIYWDKSRGALPPVSGH